MDQTRTVLDIRNLRWNDTDQGVMIADVLFVEMETAGYLPFVISSNDVTAHGRDLWAKAIARDYGEIGSYVAQTPTVDDYKFAIVAMLDAKAQERRYDGAVSISTYIGSTIPAWAAEAVAFVAWRDAVWGYAYTELDKVMNGERPQPSVEDFIAELPALSWPA